MKSEEELLRLAKEKGWESISINEKLPKKFIEKYQDKVDWCWISRYQKLSESFIEKYQDKVDWSWISYFQKLSEDFILNNFSKIDLNKLKQNKHFNFNNKGNTELNLLLELRGEI